MSWVRVCAVDEVPAETSLPVEVDGTRVCVTHSEGEFFAIYDECSHAEVPLSEGEVEDCTVECWLHGSRFDLRTGKPISLPATEPVPVYPIKITGSDVFVDVTQNPGAS